MLCGGQLGFDVNGEREGSLEGVRVEVGAVDGFEDEVGMAVGLAVVDGDLVVVVGEIEGIDVELELAFFSLQKMKFMFLEVF